MPADPAQTHVAKTFAHNAPLLGCRIDPVGKFVYAGGQDNKIIRWDLASDAKLELAGHDSWVRGFVFSANGAVMISFGWDGRMTWWNTQTETPTVIRTVEAHLGWIHTRPARLALRTSAPPTLERRSALLPTVRGRRQMARADRARASKGPCDPQT